MPKRREFCRLLECRPGIEPSVSRVYKQINPAVGHALFSQRTGQTVTCSTSYFLSSSGSVPSAPLALLRAVQLFLTAKAEANMRTVYFLVAVVLCLPAAAAAQTKESIVPAGTLLKCTVDEPKLSSQTAQAGDPVLCHVASLGMFGEPVFPRGAYLSGRLEGFRDPGHFVGKGWMKLEFDHISLPDTVLPVPVKLVGVRGYRVDREEKILGRGHAKRDTVEWLIPPLWPWKVLSLPARGPRPTLKGETQFTLRLMEDVAVPLAAVTSRSTAPQARASGQVEWKLWTPPTDWSARSMNHSSPITYVPPSAPAMHRHSATASSTTPAGSFAMDSKLPAEPRPGRLTLIALKEGTTYGVTDYWIENSQLSYTFGNGAQGTFDFGDVDWWKTIQLNAERGTVITLRAHTR